MRQTRIRILPVLLLAVWGASARTPAVQAGPWGDPRKLETPPLNPIQVPEPVRTVLPNGMVVYLLEDHEFPLVDARALVRVGSIYEPASKVGLARITGEVMRTGGSTTVDGDSLDRVLEGLGASVEISIGDTQGSASVSTLSEDFATGLAILADLLRRPAFPEGKLELAKTSARTAIAARNDEMMSILFREFPKRVLGADHPYARHSEHATIEAIARQDLVGFHRSYFHPDRIILTVFGDFDSGKVGEMLRAEFGDWEKASGALPPDPEMPGAGKPGLWFASKADATNTGILIGHLGLRMSDPDYPAMSLLNEVLGGGFSGRLMNEIRTRRGLAYATGSNSGAGIHHPGSFVVHAVTRADSSAATAGYLMDEIRKVLNAPVGADEIELARSGILNSLVFTLSSKGAVLNRLAEYEYYGYPQDFLQRYQEAIRVLTPDDLLEVARRRIRPAELVTVMVGNGEIVRPQLVSLGQATELDITIPEAGTAAAASSDGASPAPVAPGATPAAAAAAVPATPADYEKGRALLERASQATFQRGPDAVRDLTIDETGKAHIGNQGFPIGGRTIRVFPDCQWTQHTLPFGLVTTAQCDGQVWTKSQRGVRVMGPEETAGLDRERERELLGVLRTPGRPRARALPGNFSVGSRPARAALVESQTTRDWTIFFDEESGRVVRMEYVEQTPGGGAPGLVRVDFRDYRDVGGLLWWPHLLQREVGGQPFITLETTAAVANTAPDRSIFAKPAE